VPGFWQLISAARAGAETCCEVAARATSLATALPAAELLAVHRSFSRLMDDSYRHRLWAAADLMKGGCTDDGFDYFRGWLLTRGQAVFEAALASPDTLADELRPSWLGYECEEATYITFVAYKEVTGVYPPASPRPPEISWEFEFDDEQALRRYFPRLSALYLT